jgi:hypothetical protein
MNGDIGKVGEWIGREEDIIDYDDINNIMNEENESIIRRKMEENKELFDEIKEIKKKLKKERM